MLNHLLRLLGRAAEDFPKVLGGNWVSVLLPIILFILVEGNELRKGGLPAMKTRLGANARYLAGAYIVLFAWSVVRTTYHDHMDLAASAQRGHTSALSWASQATSCHSDLNAATGTIRDKQSLVDTLQKTMVSMEGPEAQQQANIASCITNLAKMNPIIMEKITVISVPLGTIDPNGKFVSRGSLLKKYIMELIVLTNIRETGDFHGRLKCSQDFQFTQIPSIRADAQMVMVSNEAPIAISSNEYEIRVNQSNTEWNSSHPAFMQIVSSSENLGFCTFTKME